MFKTSARRNKRLATALAATTTVALLLAACGTDDENDQSNGSGSSSENSELATVWESLPTSLNSIVGIAFTDQGFDKKNGFELDVQVVNDPNAAIQMPARGDTEFGTSPVTNGWGTFMAGAKDLRLIGLNVQQAMTEWCTHPDSGITSVADLKGKSIATVASPYLDYVLTTMLAAEGMDLDDIEKVSVQGPGDAVTAVENQVTDAGWCVEPQVSRAKQAGTLTSIWKARDEMDSLSDGVFTSQKMIDEHPEQVQAYMDALAETQAWIAANVKEAAEMYAKEAKIDVAVAEAAIADMARLLNPCLDMDRLQEQADNYEQLGMLPEKLDVTSVVVPEFAKAAAAKHMPGTCD